LIPADEDATDDILVELSKIDVEGQKSGQFAPPLPFRGANIEKPFNLWRKVGGAEGI
jgi:hypothetical protein